MSLRLGRGRVIASPPVDRRQTADEVAARQDYLVGRQLDERSSVDLGSRGQFVARHVAGHRLGRLATEVRQLFTARKSPSSESGITDSPCASAQILSSACT